MRDETINPTPASEWLGLAGHGEQEKYSLRSSATPLGAASCNTSIGPASRGLTR
jgi:hypothetical protein